MCGIVGYNGIKSCVDLVYSCLKRLEYRGYDSSGIAVLDQDKISLIKKKGKLSELENFLPSLPASSSLGMGHTRWATHGAPSAQNAHPHMEEGVSIIHNGILENYKELKLGLLEQGASFLSDTDSEVIVHMLQHELRIVSDVRKALLNIVDKIEGTYALGILVKEEPDHIYVVKQASPLVIGLGEQENFFASDALALSGLTNRFIFLEDGEIARISKDKVEIWDFFGKEIKRESVHIDAYETGIEKAGYRHFMLKEIHEQPAVFANTIQRLVDFENQTFQEQLLGLKNIDLDKISKIHIVACGTAYYAGLLGKYILEPCVQIPVDVELASEFRYRQPFINSDTLLISVTQSGETADTLACVKYAKKFSCQTFSICNVPYSSIPRESSFTLYMEAGAEIGVASTKAFTSMVLNFYLLALAWGHKKKSIEKKEIENHLEFLRQLPNLTEHALSFENSAAEIANHYFEELNCLFVGRGLLYPLALEGALKLKEISYIHAEGYAGGELKHGPIALIDRSMPVVALAPRVGDYEKIISNLEEIAAREGRLIGVGDKDDEKLLDLCKHVIPCPQIQNAFIQAIVSTIPLQLFSYYMAVRRGTDVDQPRNLAKSVTVE